jgi:membrane protease YdiL (CAAX protease family)
VGNSVILKKYICIAELVVLFIGLPIIYLFDFLPGLWKMIPLLIFISYCLVILIKAEKLSAEDLKLKGVRKKDWIKLLIFPSLLFLLLFLLFPDNILSDYNNPKVLLAIIAYPIFSSLPQEVIYRKFFYFRYSDLIRNKYLLIILNAVLFSFAHIYFQNYIALVLTLLGGLVFSLTYFKSKSLLFVSIEHSIYGLALLCSSMNQFFYKEF